VGVGLCVCVMSFCHRSTHYLEPRNSPAVYHLKDSAVTKSTVLTLLGGSKGKGESGTG